MSRPTIPLKQGDRLAEHVTIYEENPDTGERDLVDLSDTDWLAESRDPATDELHATFTVDVLDQDTNRGELILRAEPDESTKLRSGDYLDVEDTVAGFTWLEFTVDLSKDAAHA